MVVLPSIISYWYCYYFDVCQNLQLMISTDVRSIIFVMISNLIDPPTCENDLTVSQLNPSHVDYMMYFSRHNLSPTWLRLPSSDVLNHVLTLNFFHWMPSSLDNVLVSTWSTWHFFFLTDSTPSINSWISLWQYIVHFVCLGKPSAQFVVIVVWV